ncbi:MAG: hypothetical protein WCH76_06440 [Candidatus Riflemargulisbacteria bacterium]
MSITNEFLDTPEQSEEEVVEETTNEEVDTDDLDSLSKEDLAAALIKLDASNKQLHARVAKAEAKAKEVKTATINKTKENEPINVEEQIDLRFLQRDGLSDEDINQLKFIQAGARALGKNITLLEAQNNELYKAYQSGKELEVKRAKAQINSNGASGGSSAKVMTDEEHKAFAADKAAQLLGGLGR